MLPTLLYLPHSPWSLKALCAIHHHCIEVREVPYRPFLDDPAARFRLARSKQPWTGRISVPMLFTGTEVARSSWEVARYADAHGRGATLFAPRDFAQIVEWNERSERILSALRARFMLRVLASVPALRELAPPPLARMPAAVLRVTVGMFNAKYGIAERDTEQHERQISLELDTVRAALAHGQRYLCGSFSYADIAIGIALQALQPIPGSGFGPASEELAREPALGERYPDLIAWRNALHARHPLVKGHAPSLTRSGADFDQQV